MSPIVSVIGGKKKQKQDALGIKDCTIMAMYMCTHFCSKRLKSIQDGKQTHKCVYCHSLINRSSKRSLWGQVWFLLALALSTELVRAQVTWS